MAYIYVYFDPSRELEAFYVGKGKGERSHYHLKRKDRHPFTQRLQKMAKLGVITYIERYEDLTEEAALSLEVALIKEIGRKDLGTGTLLNLTDGGEGLNNPSPETREKMSTSRKALMTDDFKASISASLKGKKMSDELKHKHSLAMTGENHPFFGKHHSDETKEKIRKSKKGVPQSDEMKEKTSLWQKGRPKSQEHKDKIKAALSSDEARAKQSEKSKAGWIKRKEREANFV